MSFDEIFDLTAGVYFNFYNICIHLVYIFKQKNMTLPIKQKLTYIVYYKYQKRNLQDEN